MIAFDTYFISSIAEQDAASIHTLMIENAARFKRFFPKTLADNLTLTLAKEFASKKQQQFTEKKEFLFTIKENTIVIGLVYIKELDWTKKQGEFAYCISKEYKGQGLIRKAVHELTKYAFAELGLEIVQIIVHKNNLASVKVAINNGFTWQKTLIKGFTPPNETALDMELYELYKNQK